MHFRLALRTMTSWMTLNCCKFRICAISQIWEAIMKLDQYCQQQNCSPLNVLFSSVQTTSILMGVPLLWVYNHNTVGENEKWRISTSICEDNLASGK